jgi:Ser/Thr protein kinase RdoA (MazF antagonist)
MSIDLNSIAALFRIEGRFERSRPIGAGHIHNTYLVETADGAFSKKYVFQQINTRVFRDPAALMDNIVRVTGHLRNKWREKGGTDLGRRAPQVVPTLEGGAFLRDSSGQCWRAYAHIDDSISVDTVRSAEQAREIARAFGEFARLLVDLPDPAPHETIPRFHDGEWRFERLVAALRENPLGRAGAVQAEIQFALERETVARTPACLRAEGALPVRLVHNDCKVNNVMLDAREGRALCVIDLDTVMNGLVVYDFGDLVRTAASPAPEDETDLDRVKLDMGLFQALLEGYCEGAGDTLTAGELRSLPFAGKYMAYLHVLRFLTDHLMGDVYFKIHRPGHNLDRCRAQIALLRSMEERSDDMGALVR